MPPKCAALLFAALCLLPSCAYAQTGVVVPELETFDRLVPEFLNRRSCPRRRCGQPGLIDRRALTRLLPSGLAGQQDPPPH